MIRYFARLLTPSDYPHNGTPTWCVVDNRGGAVACASEQDAKDEAERRNRLAQEKQNV